MLRRTLLASAGAMALTGAALAAEPALAPPPVIPPPPPAWTGLYVGFNAGGTWSNSTTIHTTTEDIVGNPGVVGGPAFGVASADLATGSISPVNHSGFIGGGQVGYNYQFNNSWSSWVAGIEADIQGVAASNSAHLVFGQAFVPGFAGSPIDQNLSSSMTGDFLGTVRGRLGFTIIPTLLFYGTGGLAYGQTDSRTSITQIVENDPALPNHYSSFGSISNSRVGWTAGGGGEWLFAPNWSVKVEYLYYNLGSVSYGLTPLQNFNTAGTLFTDGAPFSRASFRGNIVRAGLNYHFNFTPPPVVAKY
ncbi:MAG: outer-membrane immunogenic protein precursor [Beijerinckiaceae bacterium]|nr:MAG: outer-membrane immunogenic protein precursor [Beijerinckiaceae bacterium]CAJ01574.1 outer membrane protein [uncultured bacterium]